MTEPSARKPPLPFPAGQRNPVTMDLLCNVPLAPWTTLRLGGPAARFAEAHSEKELVELLEDAESSQTPVLVLGGGSNVVVSDEGFAGQVIRIAIPGVEVQRLGSRVHVTVAAGEQWDAFVGRCTSEGWAGLECLSGIPGLVGATPIQNVGAYGAEVVDSLVDVRVYDRDSAEFVHFSRGACKFGYRSSVFRGSSRYVVTRVVFELARATHSAPIRYAELATALGITNGQSAPSATVRDTVVRLRRAKGMVCDPNDPDSVSAGSFFVNPILSAQQSSALLARLRELGLLGQDAPLPGFDAGTGQWKVPAAWLIERAGFPKGTTRGRVGISSKHALALVNQGGTTRELLALEAEIRAAVQQQFGIELHREPVLVGF